MSIGCTTFGGDVLEPSEGVECRLRQELALRVGGGVLVPTKHQLPFGVEADALDEVSLGRRLEPFHSVARCRVLHERAVSVDDPSRYTVANS